MTDAEIARINELYKKSKSEEGLTEAEKAEQKELRTRFVASFRANLKSQLDTIKIQKEDGTLIDLKERHQNKYGN
ncbi:MAG: DUF896 domain-containing protein [Lachnospiraceae bacterium]|nr:DUF896 domain-containing protein [Lachnospiraceae bacterium]